jgi:uncharacterized Zn-binding protein involved in type VI secretion
VKRYILRKGDITTNGGVVLEGVENCTDHGIPITFIGARVWCNGCKSEGFIGSKGPHRTATMHGKQQALDGDICICKCHPSPAIRASQEHSSHSWEARELAALGFDPYGKPLEKQPTGGYDELVRVIDANGHPITDAPYHIRTENGEVYKGLTDASGYCPRVYTRDAAQLDIAIGMRALERWSNTL